MEIFLPTPLFDLRTFSRPCLHGFPMQFDLYKASDKIVVVVAHRTQDRNVSSSMLTRSFPPSNVLVTHAYAVLLSFYFLINWHADEIFYAP